MSFLFNKKEDRALSFKDIFLSGGELEDYESPAMREATYFTCVDYISSNIAKLPLEVLNIDENGGKLRDESSKELNYTLSVRANNSMNAYMAIKTFIALGLHDGISGLYITKDKQLVPVKVASVIVDDVGLIDSQLDNPVLYSCVADNASFECLDRDLIVFKYGYSSRGTHTSSVRSLIANNLNVLAKGNKHVIKTLENNGLGKIAIQLTSDIKDSREISKLQDKFNKLYTSDGNVFTMPTGYTIQNLSNSMKEDDYDQIRKTSIREMCATFHLPPQIVGLVEGLSYNSSEQLILDVYTQCFQPIISQIQQEFSYKLISKANRYTKVIEFDETELYKNDMQTRVNILCQLKDKGVLTTEDVRRDLGYAPLNSEYSNEILMTSGYMPESLAKIYYTGKVGGNVQNDNENDNHSNMDTTLEGGESVGDKIK